MFSFIFNKINYVKPLLPTYGMKRKLNKTFIIDLDNQTFNAPENPELITSIEINSRYHFNPDNRHYRDRFMEYYINDEINMDDKFIEKFINCKKMTMYNYNCDTKNLSKLTKLKKLTVLEFSVDMYFPNKLEYLCVYIYIRTGYNGNNHIFTDESITNTMYEWHNLNLPQSLTTFEVCLYSSYDVKISQENCDKQKQYLIDIIKLLGKAMHGLKTQAIWM